LISQALEHDIDSIMADGSELVYEDNIAFTREMVRLAKNSSGSGAVEAELGKISGMEDGKVVQAYHQLMTDPDQAVAFVSDTGVDALAVCIGNVHGNYHRPPQLDFTRLDEIAARVAVPLVLHGTSGLPDEMITRLIGYWVCKFNVNTEVRSVYLKDLRDLFGQQKGCELTVVMEKAIKAIKFVVQEKIRLFGSAGKS
jgi:tagatose 1,6-diphosphate aldolase GatY/KbaY